MIHTFRQYLTESFDSKPARWKFRGEPREVDSISGAGKDIKMAAAGFVIDGNQYSVDLYLLSTGETEIDFSLEFVTDDGFEDDTQNMTGTGNQYKVLATVMDFIRYVIRNYENDIIKFSAVKPGQVYGKEGTSRSRAKVYERLIKQQIRSIEKETNEKWSYRKEERDRIDVFFIRKERS